MEILVFSSTSMHLFLFLAKGEWKISAAFRNANYAGPTRQTVKTVSTDKPGNKDGTRNAGGTKGKGSIYRDRSPPSGEPW